MPLSLHQEYLLRHNCSVPIVLYRRKTSVLLKNPNYDGSIRWQIFTIYWKEDERHPGYFEFEHFEANHNSFQKGKLFTPLHDLEKWFWDDYEIKILNLARMLKESQFVAITSDQKKIAGWEMFLFLTDAWLAKSMDNSFYKLVEKTLSKDFPLEQRILACVDCQNYLSKVSKTAWDFWQYTIFPIIKDADSDWFASLVNE